MARPTLAARSTVPVSHRRERRSGGDGPGHGERQSLRIPVPIAHTSIPAPTGPRTDASAPPLRCAPIGETYAELKAAALAHRDLFDEAAASSGESAESDSFDCHCTD